MNYNKISNRELIIILFIVFAAIIRLIPHPPNFAPITAMALFGGVYFKNRKLAYAIPLIAMIISDLFLGFYSISIFVYASFIAITFIGTIIKNINVANIFLSSLNILLFSVWLLYYMPALSHKLILLFLSFSTHLFRLYHPIVFENLIFY